MATPQVCLPTATPSMLTALTTRSLSSGRGTGDHTAFSHVHDSVGLLTSFGSVKQISLCSRTMPRLQADSPLSQFSSKSPPSGFRATLWMFARRKVVRHQPAPRGIVRHDVNKPPPLCVVFFFSKRKKLSLLTLCSYRCGRCVFTPSVVLGSDCVGDKDRFNETDLIPRKKDFYRKEFLQLKINCAPALLLSVK